jgi:hypothetical protein
MSQTTLIHRAKLVLFWSSLAFLPALRGAESQTLTAPALPGVPIADEPHHHLIFQNPLVNVYAVEVAPGDATLMHQHYYDNLFVAFGDADLTETVSGKESAVVALFDLGVRFAHEPYAHVIANNGKQPFRNVTVEFLQRQGEMKSFASSIDDALNDNPAESNNILQGEVLETERVQVTAVAVASGAIWEPPHDGHDRLVVFVDRSNVPFAYSGSNSPFPFARVAWFPAGTNASLPNVSGEQMRLMVSEFKDTSPEAD